MFEHKSPAERKITPKNAMSHLRHNYTRYKYVNIAQIRVNNFVQNIEPKTYIIYHSLFATFIDN